MDFKETDGHYFEVNIIENIINLMPIMLFSFIFMCLFTSQISLRYLNDKFLVSRRKLQMHTRLKSFLATRG